MKRRGHRRPSESLEVYTFPLTLPNFTQEMCRSTKCLSWHSYTLHAHEILLIIIIMMLTLRRMFYLQVLSLNAHLWVAINAEALFYSLINERSENISIEAGAHQQRNTASFNFHIVDVKNLDSFYQIYGITGFQPTGWWLLPKAVFVLFIDFNEHLSSRHFQVLLRRKGNNVLFSARQNKTWRCDIIRPSACFWTILPIPERDSPCTWPNLKTFAFVVFILGRF